MKTILQKLSKEYITYEVSYDIKKQNIIYLLKKNDINKIIEIYWKHEFKKWLLVKKNNKFYLNFKNKYFPLTFSFEKKKFYIYTPIEKFPNEKLKKQRIFKFPFKYKAYNVLKLRSKLEIYHKYNILEKI